MKKLIFLLLVILTLWKFWSMPGEVTLGPGVMAADDPVQMDIDNPSSFDFGKHKITQCFTSGLGPGLGPDVG